jgi:hypothetical protein
VAERPVPIRIRGRAENTHAKTFVKRLEKQSAEPGWPVSRS